MKRLVTIALLLLVACASLTFAFGVLRNLWLDDAENGTATYLVLGLPLLAFGLLALAALVASLRARS